MTQLIQSVVAIVAITNPLGAAPFFLTLTDGAGPAERRHYAIRASIAVVLILAVSTIGGQYILRAFGITLPAFQAAGGLVILLMGLEMLRGTPTRVNRTTGPDAVPEPADDTILVPFAMPLVAGPGSITTVITLASRGGGWGDTTETLVAVGIAGIALLVTLVSAEWVGRHIGRRGHGIILRFLGLILLAIGAQMVLAGFHGFEPL